MAGKDLKIYSISVVTRECHYTSGYMSKNVCCLCACMCVCVHVRLYVYVFVFSYVSPKTHLQGEQISE